MTRAHSPLTHTREREREGAFACARARARESEDTPSHSHTIYIHAHVHAPLYRSSTGILRHSVSCISNYRALAPRRKSSDFGEPLTNTFSRFLSLSFSPLSLSSLLRFREIANETTTHSRGRKNRRASSSSSFSSSRVYCFFRASHGGSPIRRAAGLRDRHALPTTSFFRSARIQRSRSPRGESSSECTLAKTEHGRSRDGSHVVRR